MTRPRSHMMYMVKVRSRYNEIWPQSCSECASLCELVLTSMSLGRSLSCGHYLTSILQSRSRTGLWGVSLGLRELKFYRFSSTSKFSCSWKDGLTTVLSEIVVVFNKALKPMWYHELSLQKTVELNFIFL